MTAAPVAPDRPTGLRVWAPWIAMAVIVVVALAVGTIGQSQPTDAERAEQIAGTIRCPSCRSQAASSGHAVVAGGAGAHQGTHRGGGHR